MRFQARPQQGISEERILFSPSQILQEQRRCHGVVGLGSVVKRELIRPNYSCPPLHGARIAAAILGTPSLCTRWLAELRGMVDRMRAVRGALVEQLKTEQQVRGGVSWDWGHLLRQNGMFALTGLSSLHVEALRSEHNIYMTKDGRLSVAGLRLKDVPAVARAIIAVLNAE